MENIIFQTLISLKKASFSITALHPPDFEKKHIQPTYVNKYNVLCVHHNIAVFYVHKDDDDDDK